MEVILLNRKKPLIALITGCSRGIGKELAIRLAQKDCYVILTTRNKRDAYNIVEYMHSIGLNNVTYQYLDVTKNDSIIDIKLYIEKIFGRVDLLINNAGIYLDNPRNFCYKSIIDLDPDWFATTLATNTEGPLRLIWWLLPLMKKNNYGRIVNVSSGMGRFADLNTEGPFYRISKLALNALTKIVSIDVKDYNILINAVCPGWVKTDMGGINADKNIEEAIGTIINAAFLPDNGYNGCFLRNNNILDWSSK